MDLGSLYFKIDADTGQVTVASNELNKLEASSKKAEMSTDKLGNSIKKTDADLGRFIDKSGKMREANGKFVRSASEATKAVDVFGDSVSVAGGVIAGLGKTIIAAAVSMITLQTALAGVSQIIAFEDAMLGLRATLGGTDDQMKKLEKQARSLGAASIYSAEQAAQAQRFLAMAGFDVNEVLSATPNILKLATAGQLDLAEAADIASNVLGGFSMKAKELSRVNDVMAKTAASSNTSINQLGEALSYAAPIAASAGISLEETSAAIGKLSDNGIQGSRAGTGLLGIIRQLAKPTTQAGFALSKYGLSIADVNIETNGLTGVLEKLRDANIDTADSFTIFGSEAGPAAQILATNSTQLDDLTKKLKNAEGAASDMADIIGSGLSASLKGLSSQVSESVLQLGDSGLAGSLDSVVKSAASVLAVYNGMIEEYAKANNLTEEQKHSAIDLANALDKSTTAAISGAAAYAAYAVAVNAAAIKTALLTAATRANPIGLAVTALGAVAGLMLSFADDTQKAADAMATLADKSGKFNDTQKEAARLNLIAEEIKLEKEITKLKAEQAKNKYPGIENLPEHMKTLHGVNDEWSGVNGKLTIAEQKLAKIRERIKEFGNLQITIDSGAGQDSDPVEKKTREELPLYDYDLYYSARIEATREYSEELAALVGTYQKTEKPLDRLKKDQARLNELMLIAGEKDAPKLKAAIEEIEDQIEALATNKINWESIGTTAATSITDAIRSGDWQNVAGDIAQSAGMAIGTAVAGPIGGIVGSAIGAELFKAVEIADTYKNNQLLQGTGTVFGDSAAKTESILKSSEITASATQNLVGINRDMLTAMQTLNRGITGASGLIGRDVPTGFGELGSVQSIDLLGAGWATEKITNALLGGSSKVTDEGIKIVGGTLDDIINTTTATAFAEVKTKKNRWASTKTSVQSRSVGSAVEQQLDLVFVDIFAAVEASATALGMSGSDIGDTLSNFVVDSFDISLKGMDADQRTEALQNVFSKVFDNLSNAVVPFLDEFQQSGEGTGETMSRLATQLQITQRATQMLGNEVSQLGTRDAVYMSDYLIKAAGSMGQLTSQVQSFVDNFYSDEERLALALKDLRAEFSELGMTLPASKDGFKALVQSMDESTESGAANLATLLRIQGAASDYYDLLERTADVQQKIADAQDTVRAAFELFQSQSSALKTSLLELVSNEAALAYQRETELEALDPLLRETQKRVWALQDEKARMEEAAKAGEKYRSTVKSSLDFINGTFASIESFTLGLRGGSSAAASSTYRSTLMAAQSGDRAALTGLPSSAQAFLDEQMKSARSLDEYNRSVERVIADLEGIHSAMPPEEFLAKEIAASLKETGETLKQQLEKLPDQLQGVIEKSKYEIDVLMDLAVNDASLDSDLRTLLIKTVDGATATIDLIANDDSIPDNYKKMILQQQIDANAAISAALTSDTDATIKRAIVEGQIATSATINAAIGANTDERVKTMIINGALSSAATIDAALSTNIDASTKALIVSKQKDYQVMLQAALSASSTEDALTIIQSADEINKHVTLEAAQVNLTPEQSMLLQTVDATITKTLQASGGNLTNDQKTILDAINSVTEASVRADIALGDTAAGDLSSISEDATKQLSALELNTSKLSGMVTNLDILSSSVSSLDDAIRALYGLQENDRASTARAAELRTAIADQEYKISSERQSVTSLESSLNSASSDSVKAIENDLAIRSENLQTEFELSKQYGGWYTQYYNQRVAEWANVSRALVNEKNKYSENLATMNKISQISNSISALTSNLESLKTELTPLEAQGYSSGGYTGSGGISEPAGIVHKGEYVVSQSMISKLGGNQFINEMEMIRRGGYANGGLVGMSPISMVPQSTMDGGYLRAMTRTMSDMQNEIKALRDDQHSIGLRMLNNTRDTADMLESFNIIGLPPTRA